MVRPSEMNDERSDEELMTAYRNGDEGAFRTLFDRYAARLARTLRRSIRSDEDCREIVQYTFLHLHRARLDFREGSQLRPWLYTICMNLRREHFRRRLRRPESTLELDGRNDPIAEAHDPVRLERIRQIRALVAELPNSQREVIELHWFEGLSFPEVADVVGASVSAVKVRAHRGYQTIRAKIAHEERNPSEIPDIPPGRTA